MRNERTPRTLAETSFTTGYSRAEFAAPLPWTERLLGVAMALVIAAAAVALVLQELGAL
jgi:hypothetical protein